MQRVYEENEWGKVSKRIVTVLGPVGLMVGKDFGCGKVFQVLMIRDHINWSSGTFEVVLPDMESFKDCKQFFVMGVIVEH